MKTSLSNVIQSLVLMVVLFYAISCTHSTQAEQKADDSIPTEYEELAALKAFSRDAIQECANRLTNVDPKFEGVINFGKVLQKVSDKIDIDIDSLTTTNKDYWRAVLEMAPTDPSILFAHAYLHIIRGEISKADTYFLLGSLIMDDAFRKELSIYNKLRSKLNKRMTHDIQRGIEHHDRKKYDQAIKVYDRVIEQYPNCAWAYYEKGLSYLMKGKGNRPLAERMFSECRQRDPFHWRAYQGSDQEVIQKLMVFKKIHPFISGEKRNVETFKMFAEGCEEIELYPIAAHSRWILTVLDREHMKDHIKIFLDLLSKSGCKDAQFFRDQFKLD